MKETTVSSTSILVLRIAVSGIFIAAGTNHLQKPQGIAKRILEAPSGEFVSAIADTQCLALSCGVGLLFFGITFVLGVYRKISASALALLLLLITFTIRTDGGILFGPLWKNVAIFGGLSLFIINKNLPYQIFPKTK